MLTSLTLTVINNLCQCSSFFGDGVGRRDGGGRRDKTIDANNASSRDENDDDDGVGEYYCCCYGTKYHCHQRHYPHGTTGQEEGKNINHHDI